MLKKVYKSLMGLVPLDLNFFIQRLPNNVPQKLDQNLKNEYKVNECG